MAAQRPPSSLGEVLVRRRRRYLVGRADEVAAFRAALAADRPAVVFVHGPGGIGKSSLLDLFAEVADESHVPVRRLDGREMQPTVPAALDAVGDLPDSNRLVLMVDGYERLVGLDTWFRSHLLPGLPASTVTVLAGRTPPDPGWRSDPGWRDVLEVVALRNLGRKECEEYLQQCGVEPGVHDRIVEVTHGHPLGLSLLADVVARGGQVSAESLSPDLVATLLRQLLDVVPNAEQRRALGACALARVTTEPLLRAALDVEDAHEAFEWLRGLSFVESGTHGLFPHDLARDALDADLQWRDPQAYATTFQRITDHLVERLTSTRGPGQVQAVFDAKFMHRHQPISKVWADWESFGQHHPEPARPADRAAVLEIVERWEGSESAAVAERWLDRQPGGFAVVRQSDGQVRGVLAMIDLTAAGPDDLAADPGASAAWRYAQRQAPPRPGERVTQSRFMIDREAYHQPSPTMNLAPVLSIQHYLQTPGLSLDLITMDDVERWEEYFTFFEIRRAAGAEFELGGRRFGLFARDFRQIPLDPWLRLMFERDLMGPRAETPSAPSLPVVVLSRDDFEASVRDALRSARRSDRLAGNPLLRSRLVLARAEGRTPVETLRGLLHESAERLRDDPREEKLFRVVDRTFLRPAASQEMAAELLGLPLTTYKRHLKTGTDRIVADLWERELGLD